MSASIRMTRIGANKIASYRIVVSATRAKSNGAQLDTLGYYRPGDNPRQAQIDLTKTREWLRKGAIPSPTVQRLVKMAEAAVTGGSDPQAVKIVFSTAKTKKTHKERLAAKKKKE